MAVTNPVGKNLVRNAAWSLVAIGLVYGSYRSVTAYMGLDPFKKLRQNPVNGLGDEVGIRMSGVKMAMYTNGKLVAKADMDRVDGTPDRHKFDLRGIKNGLYYSDQGPVQFAAGTGSWNTLSQQLNVGEKARVQSKDFDLSTQTMLFDTPRGNLRLMTPISGKLQGGQLIAANFKYNFKTGNADSDSIRWRGKLTALQEASQEPVSPRTWDLSGKFSRRNGKDYYKNARAEDGEVIVMAPEMVRDIKSDIITATGRVTYYSGKANVVADKVVVYRKEHRAVFTGNVVMLVKPKKDQDKKPEVSEIKPFRPEVPSEVAKARPQSPINEEEKKKDDELRSGKTIRNYPLSITAGEVTYWYKKGERHAVFQGNPQAFQSFPGGRWRQAWTNNGQYDGETDMLQLNSTPGKKDTRMKNSIGDDLIAKMMLLSTKEDQDEDTESIDGDDVSARYVDLSGEDPRGEKKPEPPVTKTTPPKKGNGG